MSKPQILNAEALRAALDELKVDEAIIQRVTNDPAAITLKEVGLDSKDLLLLDFHLEEAAGLNINFDAVKDDMTVASFLAEIAPTEQ